MNLWTRTNFRQGDRIRTMEKSKADHIKKQCPDFGTLLEILEKREGRVRKIWPDESDGTCWKELKAEGYIQIQWDEPITNGKQFLRETWIMPHFCNLIQKGSEVAA